MQFLVLSDSHGRADRLIRVAEEHPDIRAVLFLGDGLSDIAQLSARFPDLSIRAVRGNCDGLSLAYHAETEDLFDLFGCRVLMFHGHTHGVKWDTLSAEAYAQKKGARVLLFGHTHEPLERYLPEKEMWMFNPGSIGHPYDGRPTYGILDILPDGGCVLSHGYLTY